MRSLSSRHKWAQKAIKSIQVFTLDGHMLHVKFMEEGVEVEVNDRKPGAKSNTMKIIVNHEGSSFLLRQDHRCF